VGYVGEKAIYQGKEVDVYTFLREIGIDNRLYRRRRLKGKSIQESFLECINFYGDQFFRNISEKGLINSRGKVLKKYQERGLPKRFLSLQHFCSSYYVDYKSFLKILSSNPDYDFKQALSHYYSVATPLRVSEFSYCGVSLKAICIKFQLNEAFCVNLLKKGMSWKETLELAVIYSPCIPKKYSAILERILPLILSTPTNHLSSLCSLFNLPEMMMSYLYYCKRQITRIQKALYVYQVVSFLDNDLEDIYEDSFESLQVGCLNSSEYWSKYNKKKREIRSMVINELQLTNEDLKRYYEYYNDFIPQKLGDTKVWGYNRQRILGVK